MKNLPSTLFSLPSTLYSLPSTLFSLPSTLFSLPSTLYSLPSTLYSLPSTLYSLPSTLYSLPSTLYSLLFTLCLCTACNEQQVYRIGVSQCSEDDWRTKMNEEIRREAMFHDNIEVEIRSADDSNERQIEDIRYFANNGFDIIVCAPNEADALTPVIKEVYESGMPVMLFDRKINGDTYTAWQGADNKEIGQHAAEMAWSLLGDKAQIVSIYGLEGSTPTLERRAGFREASDRLGMTVLGGGHGNWEAKDATRAADSLLRLYPQANLIFAHNDRMAIAASEVARSMGRDVKVIGIDATPTTGIPGVMDGKLDATFIYPTDGYRLIRSALDILEGREVQRNYILPSPGAVDKSNAHILHQQNLTLKEETEKITWLQGRIDIYWQQYTSQRIILYGLMIIMTLLAFILFTVIRNHRISNEQKRKIEQQRDELATQRDTLATQRDTLATQRDTLAAQRDTLAAQRDELDGLYQKLQEATASKLAFFTNVSHDLRTPLTLIADPVQQMTTADNLTPQQHTLMELANKNVKRLMRLINQILDIHKADTGSLKLNLTYTDLGTLINEWTSAFQQAAKRNHIKLQVDIASDDLRTMVDIEKVERILFNLISNAFKFTPQNGTIRVALGKNDSTTGDSVASAILLTVSDTGRGIQADEVSKVFDQFFTTGELNPNGSGIGLALSKIFAEMHGGTITVTSEPGVGTTFTVTLPYREGTNTVSCDSIAGSTTARQDEIAALQSASNIASQIDELTDVHDEEIPVSETAPTILIIDDNPDICTLVRTTLGEDFTVAQALNGAQGIRLATKYVPDLIICDVMMPGMDGYETCRRLKNEVTTSHIPVLMLTAAAGDENRTESYECGADGYMSKPFDHKMLLARCKNMIENRRKITTPPQPSPQGEGALNVVLTASKGESKSPLPCGEGWGEVEFYQRFAQIVEKHLGDSEFSVEDIADKIGLSRVQLYRKLKALTNYSPTDLQRIIRLRHADRILKTTEQTISEIAYTVGFSSPSYFTKCYRDYYNESPSDVQARTSKMKG